MHRVIGKSPQLAEVLRGLCSSSVLFEELLCFHRGGATGTRSSDGLAVAPVLNVAAGKYAGDIGEDVVVGFDKALVGKSQTFPVFTLRSFRPVTSFFSTS